MARSRGTFVNKDVTSKEIKTSESKIRLPESELNKSKLLAMWLLVFSRLSEMMSCKKEANE